MEAKKNPRADINTHRSKFFFIGLMLSISLVITAFEWTTQKPKVTARRSDFPIETYPVIPITEISLPKPIVPLLVEKTKTTPSTIPSFVIDLTSNISDQDSPKIDLGQTYANPLIAIEPTVEIDTTEFVIIAEYQPVPLGGLENFYKVISENLKYPRQARNVGAEGKVFVEFIVDRKGNATNLKIARGIGAGCDEEAMRVIALPKWQPGKQRGRAVNVKMVMPINFRLSN